MRPCLKQSLLAALLFVLCCGGVVPGVFGQYYFTGTTVTDNDKPLAFVKLFLRSNATMQVSGSTGVFGIPAFEKSDTVICILEGYDTLLTVLMAGGPNKLVLRPNHHLQQQLQQRFRLNSLTQNLLRDPEYVRQIIGESYSETVENGFVETDRFPKTGFSPNVNNAAYSNIRRLIKTKNLVPPNAVRLEEMLNYFGLSCVAPPGKNAVFNIETRLTDCPWHRNNLLLFINAQAKQLNLDKVPPANLVFLIDNSGSMDAPNRLPLLKAGFKMLVKTLRDTDRVAVVTYGGSAGIALPPTRGSYKAKIDSAIESITPGGATPGSNGIILAYQLATTNPIPDGNNRVILATDGDFNVGLSSELELENLIESYKNSGVYLTCLGVGMGNYKDSKIEVLARHGNGNFAYLDSEAEAEKVLVKELTQNLYAVATDVTMQLSLNAALANQYRLIGYDNKLIAIKDTSSQLLGGDIGSGYSLVSVLEIEPKDSTASWRIANDGGSLGHLNLQYNLPQGAAELQTVNQSISFNYLPINEVDRNLKFAAAVVMFGNMLRKPETVTAQQYAQLRQMVNESYNPINTQQAEFLQLIEEARRIYFPEKKDTRKKWLKKNAAE